MFALVEKLNNLSLHGLFETEERAKRHLAVAIPEYVARGLFMNKELTKDSFEIIPWTK